jgi:hypothetical protein
VIASGHLRDFDVPLSFPPRGFKDLTLGNIVARSAPRYAIFYHGCLSELSLIVQNMPAKLSFVNGLNGFFKHLLPFSFGLRVFANENEMVGAMEQAQTANP